MRAWALLVLVVGCNSTTPSTAGSAGSSSGANETKPNETKPNETKPNETKPQAATTEAKPQAPPTAANPAEEPSDAHSTVRTLRCFKGDKRLGTLQFPKDGPPVLTLDAQDAAGNELKANWEKLLAKGKIKVKFHQNRDDEQPLVGIQASPGEPAYGEAVQLKMAEDYGYDCSVPH